MVFFAMSIELRAMRKKKLFSSRKDAKKREACRILGVLVS